MGNEAIDYERAEALNMARMQPPKAGDFNVPSNGRAENFHVPQRSHADNYEKNEPVSEGAKHTERLDKARRTNPSEVQAAKDLAKDAVSLASPQGVFSVVKQIDFLKDIPYALALAVAALKDLSDLVLIGSLPALGTVVTMLCSIFIFMMMMLVGAGEKKKMVLGLMKRGGILLVGTIFEFVSGLNFVPVETLTVAIVYFLVLSERKHLAAQTEN